MADEKLTNAEQLKAEQLSDEQLDNVAGGTFDANMYSKDQYKAAGVNLDSHFFAKDDFFIWSSVDQNGKSLSSPKRFRITYDAANAAVEFYQNNGTPANLSDLKNAIGGNVIRD